MRRFGLPLMLVGLGFIVAGGIWFEAWGWIVMGSGTFLHIWGE